jgi:hypothetical protein
MIQDSTEARVCEFHLTRASHQYHASRKRDLLSNPRTIPVWRVADYKFIMGTVLRVQIKTPDDSLIAIKPRDHLFGSLIDTAHLLDLVIPLLDVGLVDTESVNPQLFGEV